MRSVQAALRLSLALGCLPFCLLGCRSESPAPSLPLLPGRAAKYQPLPPVTEAASPIRFASVASRDGLHYRWTISGKRPINILQGIGDGCAFLDYDNDGNLDVLLVGPRLALYKGDGHGHFADVTRATGLDTPAGRFLGCAVGDYDNDGYDDLYISGYRTGILLHNEHGKGFRDVTREMGLQPQPFGTSCCFADLDADGFLDLFVGNYVQFDASTPHLCPQKGIPTTCSPTNYQPLKGVLYRNLAGRRFEDVTRSRGAQTTGNDLGVASADFDGSGHVALAVANDELGGDLLRTQDGGRLVNLGARSGTSVDRFGHFHGGMGIDWGDYDNDGRPDLFVTTFAREDKCLYRNLGAGLFEDRGVETGAASVLEPYVSFGCKFADFDNDGWLDLIVASGHIQDNVARIEKGLTYRQPTELLHNTGQAAVRFERITKSSGLAALPPIVGRGLAVGDYDNDGRVDALVVDSEGAPLLLHNVTPKAGHWVGFRLQGSRGGGRDAYGAVVTATLADGQTRVRQCHADGSYLSSSDKRVHFGLGESSLKGVSVRWPDGSRETWRAVPRNRYRTLVQGTGHADKTSRM